MKTWLWIVLATALGCSSLSKDAGRVLPAVASEADAEGQHRFAMVFGDDSNSQMTVSERPWIAGKRVSIQHSPLFVEIEHAGDTPIRFRESDFILYVGDDAHPGVELDRIVNHSGAGLQEARTASTLGLRPATLEAGQVVRGFVFFRKKFDFANHGDEEFLLELSLYDESHVQVIGTLRLPLVVGR